MHPITSNQRRYQVLLVGGAAPPIGGVTTHVWRLASRLAERGITCRVLDTLPGAHKYPVGNADRFVLERNIPSFVAGTEWCVASGMPDILHLHVQLTIPRVPLFRFILRLAKRSVRIITVHDGATAAYLDRMHAPMQKLWRRTLCAFDGVVAVSPTMVRDLVERIGVPQDRVISASSFVAPRQAELYGQLPDSLAELRRVAPKLILGSGYLTPDYRHEDLIEATVRLHPELGCHLLLATYGKDDTEYATFIHNQAARHPCVHLLRDIEYFAFQKLVESADAYVRTVTSESLGLVVWEADSLGTPTVATRTCERPERTDVFNVGDVRSLIEIVREVLRRGRMAPIPSAKDGVNALVEGYERLLTRRRLECTH